MLGEVRSSGEGKPGTQAHGEGSKETSEVSTLHTKAVAKAGLTHRHRLTPGPMVTPPRRQGSSHALQTIPGS